VSSRLPNAKLAALDLIFSVMDSARRPLDFTLVLHFKEVLRAEALQAGARSSRRLYPTTGCTICGKQWVRFAGPDEGFAAIEASSDRAVASAIEKFIDDPFDPHRQMPVRQLVVAGHFDGGTKLVTRFHHAAADGLSAAMWLGHQLAVACGREKPIAQIVPFRELPLRGRSWSVRKSRFAYFGPSHRLWSQRRQPSHRRRWQTFAIPAADLRQLCRRLGGLSCNDLLATCALEVFIRWNRVHGAVHQRKVGLWLPVNLRQGPVAGFGNGTSRIRIYARYADDASLLEKFRAIHRQVYWSNRHGEWTVPPFPKLARLPMWAVVPLLRCYLNRPWVDMATAVFSLAERWGGQYEESFQNVDRIECIGQLHARHPIAINGAIHRDQVWLTVTYDPALLTGGDIQQLVEMYREQITEAQRDLR